MEIDGYTSVGVFCMLSTSIFPFSMLSASTGITLTSFNCINPCFDRKSIRFNSIYPLIAVLVIGGERDFPDFLFSPFNFFSLS